MTSHALHQPDVTDTTPLRLAEETIRKMLEDFVLLGKFNIEDLRECEHCDCWLTIEECAPISDVMLCPKCAFEGGRFRNEPCYSDLIWRKAMGRKFDFEATLQEIMSPIRVAIIKGSSRLAD